MILLNLAAKPSLTKLKHLPHPTFDSLWNQIIFYFFNWIKINGLYSFTYVNKQLKHTWPSRNNLFPFSLEILCSNPGRCIFLLFFPPKFQIKIWNFLNMQISILSFWSHFIFFRLISLVERNTLIFYYSGYPSRNFKVFSNVYNI